jgi:uncharacterized protein (DUF1015 family)
VQVLPSGASGAAATRRPALELAPFRGVRFDAGLISGLAEVTAPPYDVIAHDTESELMAADPHNVVRLILPPPQAAPSGGRHPAAVTLRSWLDERVLRADPVPALYVYEQASVRHGLAVLQRGLIGALRLVAPEARVVLPHEDVAPGPVAGRLRLMEATQANFEPIFLLYDGGAPGAATRLAEDTARSALPLAEAVTSDGIRHRLWALTGPSDLAAVAADLAPRTALIADGHHRYAAYRALQARRHAAGSGPGPWDYGLALLVDSAAYPPRIGAIHRVIRGLDPAVAVELAKSAFTVRALPDGPDALDSALAVLGEASRAGPAFLVAGGGSICLLSHPDPVIAAAAMPAGRSAHWRRLAPAVLQELLLARVWGIPDDESRVRVVHSDAAAAVRAAGQSPGGGTAVLCTPLAAADVYAVAAAGEKVPRKSTSFGPKPRTGLVMRLFAES